MTVPNDHAPVSACQAVLVEDEQAVRLAIAQTLELGGFTVHPCATARQA